MRLLPDGAHAKKTLSKFAAISLVAVFLAVSLLQATTAFATGTTVNTVISGNQTPLLQVTQVTTGSGSNAVTTSPPPSKEIVIHTFFARFMIWGGVNNLIQMQVYVDGNYASTIPLTTADSSFSYALELTPGTHTITLVGISANGAQNPTSTLTVDYEDGSSPSSPGTASGSSQSSPTSGGGVLIGKPASSPANPPSSGITMPPWLYSSLLTLNIITPGSTNMVAYSNLWRILLVIAALVVIVWAKALVAAATALSKKRPVPLKWRASIRRHPVALLRSVGVLVIILVFLLP